MVPVGFGVFNPIIYFWAQPNCNGSQATKSIALSDTLRETGRRAGLTPTLQDLHSGAKLRNHCTLTTVEPSSSWTESQASLHELLVCSEQRAGGLVRGNSTEAALGLFSMGKS